MPSKKHRELDEQEVEEAIIDIVEPVTHPAQSTKRKGGTTTTSSASKKTRNVHFEDEAGASAEDHEIQRAYEHDTLESKKREVLRQMNRNTVNMLSTSSNLGHAPIKLPAALLYACGRCGEEHYYKKTDSLSCPSCKYKIVWKTSSTDSYHLLTTD